MNELMTLWFQTVIVMMQTNKLADILQMQN